MSSSTGTSRPDSSSTSRFYASSGDSPARRVRQGSSKYASRGAEPAESRQEKLSGPAAIGPRFSTNVDGPAIRHNGPYERTSSPPYANRAAVLHACPAVGD